MNITDLDHLLPPSEQLSELNLDDLRQSLADASEIGRALESKTALYEKELQRELRAKIELCGGIPDCPDPETAFTLSGAELLAARRSASRQFNQVFFMAPLSRHAPPSQAAPHVGQNPLSRASG
jgi:hypothetical protein